MGLSPWDLIYRKWIFHFLSKVSKEKNPHTSRDFLAFQKCFHSFRGELSTARQRVIYGPSYFPKPSDIELIFCTCRSNIKQELGLDTNILQNKIMPLNWLLVELCFTKWYNLAPAIILVKHLSRPALKLRYYRLNDSWPIKHKKDNYTQRRRPCCSLHKNLSFKMSSEALL